MAELELIDKNILSKFIDKLTTGEVRGKGLSSNDFTDELKEKLDRLNGLDNNEIYNILKELYSTSFNYNTYDISEFTNEPFNFETGYLILWSGYYEQNTMLDEIDEILRSDNRIKHFCFKDINKTEIYISCIPLNESCENIGILNYIRFYNGDIIYCNKICGYYIESDPYHPYISFGTAPSNIMSDKDLDILCLINELTFNGEEFPIKLYFKPLGGGTGLATLYRIYLNKKDLNISADINLYTIDFDEDEETESANVYISINPTETDKNNMLKLYDITIPDTDGINAMSFQNGFDNYNMTVDPETDETREHYGNGVEGTCKLAGTIKY